MQRSRVWLYLGAAVLLVIVFFVSRSLTRDRLPIRAATVSRGRLESTVSTNGLVEPVQEIEFHAPLASTVKLINVRQGDLVKPGQLLMQLDDVTARARVASAESGLRSAQASYDAVKQGGTLEERTSLTSSVTRAKMDLEASQRELATLTKLQATGAASASEVEASKQRVAGYQEVLRSDEERQHVRYAPDEIARAKAAVDDAAASLHAAQTVLDQTAIRATTEGTVYSIPVGHSDFVEEGRLLLKMADMKNMRVRAYFDEPEIARLAIGQPIRIVWDARQGREWHGHIVQVPSTIITYTTRNVGEVLVAIDGPDHDLLPDTHVTVTVTTSSEENSLTVPREALHSENGKSYVYQVVNNSLVRAPVVTSALNLTQVAISSGLKDGDQVATGSLNGLSLEEGIPVKVVR
jgi:HlyD family secretion protein